MSLPASTSKPSLEPGKSSIPTPVAPRRSLRRRLAFVLFAGCFVILVLEVAVRILWQEPPKLVGERLIGSGLFRSDAATGWRPTPDFEFRHHLYANPDYTIRTNSRGLRSPEHAVPSASGKPRVVVIGDSYAFGYGVEDDATFARQLESLEPGIEVINLGVTGYNLAQSHAFLVAEGLRYRPGLVVLALCQNDVIAQDIPSVAKIIAASPVQDRGPAFELSEMSKLVNLVRYAAATLRPIRRTLQAIGLKDADGGYESLDTNLRPSLREYPEPMRAVWQQTVDELQALHVTCAKAGAKLLVATIPPPQAVVEGALTRSLRYVSYTEADFDLKKCTRALSTVCKSHGITWLDTHDALATGGERYYLKFDMHLNAAGHRRYAEALQAPVRALLDLR